MWPSWRRPPGSTAADKFPCTKEKYFILLSAALAGGSENDHPFCQIQPSPAPGRDDEGLFNGQGYPSISAQPWNLYHPDQTLWWVIPGSQWPAYRFGKLFFTPDGIPEGCVFCGLHVEKGLGQGAADGYTSARGRRLLMDDDWLWHDFVQDVQAGKFSGAVAVLEQKVSPPVLLKCQAGSVLDPDSLDPQGPHPVWDVILFSAADGTLSLRHHEIPRHPRKNHLHLVPIDPPFLPSSPQLSTRAQ